METLRSKTTPAMRERRASSPGSRWMATLYGDVAPDAVRTSVHSVRAFVEDLERLVRIVGERPDRFATIVDWIDGRMVAVPTDVRWMVETDRQRRVFFDTYGREIGSVRHRRVELVLRFLGAWRAEILRCGLGKGEKPLFVYDEFIGFLLRYPLGPDELVIPRDALQSFLDHWGHRWM